MKPKQTSETEKADIVERLHAWSGACLTPDQVIQCAPSITNILREAAAEIERLRTELQARRAAEAKAVEAIDKRLASYEESMKANRSGDSSAYWTCGAFDALTELRAALGARND